MRSTAVGAIGRRNWFAAVTCGAVVTALLSSCGEQGPDGALEFEQGDLDSAPVPGARRVAILNIQEQGALDTRYRVASTLTAHNPAQALTLGFSAEGVELTPPKENFRLGMRATNVRCDEQAISLGAVPPQRIEHVHGAEYARVAGPARFAEWYINGPAGLEQGFRLESSPCKLGAQVGIEVAFEGLRPANVGDRVLLADEGGNVQVQCTDWFAIDALGKDLPIVLLVGDGAVTIRIDVADARWPVQVDPILWRRW
ncbi:MAG TPA: hypothetical protein VM686_04770 [Polyangiaceae bacterium]|nr:hypothetical protein [Polyangiaceae bacterium]